MLHLCAICGSAAPPPPCESRLQSMYSKHSGGCWEQCRRASRGGGGRAVWSPCRPLFVSHGSARVVVRGLLVPCWSAVGLAVRLVAPASLVHRWSICWCIAHPSVPLSLVHRASLWLLLCPSCIADASLMRRSSACLCTARPSACAPLVRLMVRLLESRSLLHRWVEGYRTSGRRGCSFGVAGDGIVKACSMESNGGSERKTAC